MKSKYTVCMIICSLVAVVSLAGALLLSANSYVYKPFGHPHMDSIFGTDEKKIHINKSVTVDGTTVTLRQAYTDGRIAYLLLEATFKTEISLKEDQDKLGLIIKPNINYSVNDGITNYDPSTRTASFIKIIYFNSQAIDGDNVELTIMGISIDEDTVAPHTDLIKGTWQYHFKLTSVAQMKEYTIKQGDNNMVYPLRLLVSPIEVFAEDTLNNRIVSDTPETQLQQLSEELQSMNENAYIVMKDGSEIALIGLFTVHITQDATFEGDALLRVTSLDVNKISKIYIFNTLYTFDESGTLIKV